MHISKKEKKTIELAFQQLLNTIDILAEQDAIESSQNPPTQLSLEKANEFVSNVEVDHSKLHACMNCGLIANNLAEKIEYLGTVYDSHSCKQLSMHDGPAIIVKTTWSKLYQYFFV